MLEVRKRSTPHYPKSFMRAILLCWFLGIFGIHRFYTGYKRLGVLQLLTLGGFGIWWLIDLIMILCRSYKTASGDDLV